MAKDYSSQMIQQLEQAFSGLNLHRPMRVERYEAGRQLDYSLCPLLPAGEVTARLRIERFVGGGFAGQVYQIRILQLVKDGQSVPEHGGLAAEQLYAMKILIPPSGLKQIFRNLLYGIGFQGPFQPQVNPSAARAGALWQKFIRQAAAAHFGDDECVNEIYATFVDPNIGSCGEISRWIDGRTWRLEVDDRMDLLRLWRRGKPVPPERLGSPEYRTKYLFMRDFVRLLHQMGAHEFARQYEWSTCKSQPNCLKQMQTDADPAAGLVAVDFRAGLTLLPFLPMSPGDFKLIAQGIARGSLVQFDRGDVNRLHDYIARHPETFDKMPAGKQLLNELKECERIYRNSVPDITHNHIRLLTDGRLWSTILSSAATSWRIRNQIDAEHEKALHTSIGKTLVFWLLGLVPLLGRVLRKAWGRPDWRAHYRAILSSPSYLWRAIVGKIHESLVKWLRKGRLSEKQTHAILRRPWRFFLHLPLTLLPAGLHRFLTDAEFFRSRLHSIFIRPFQLYFKAELRKQWLEDMVCEGQKKHILSKEDAETILSQVNEPFIQRYLVSLVVHLLTLPITQLVSATVAAIYYFTHPETPEEQRALAVAGILLLFQVLPISPGSFCRGLYTTCLAIHDRNFKDYNIALFLSYLKYVGYLAFPIQMTYRYPALARFMAAHWATNAVHIVPVFGEQGALLEHWIFRLCYNWPLTIRRRMAQISRERMGQKVRLWHVGAASIGVCLILAFLHSHYYANTQIPPSQENRWYLQSLIVPAILLSAAAGWTAARFAGGLARTRRIAAAAVAGVIISALYTLLAFYMEQGWADTKPAVFTPFLWRLLPMTFFAVLGGLTAEITQPSPDLKSLLQ